MRHNVPVFEYETKNECHRKVISMTFHWSLLSVPGQQVDLPVDDFENELFWELLAQCNSSSFWILHSNIDLNNYDVITLQWYLGAAASGVWRFDMVDTLPPHTPYPRWEVTGTATEGYITINVMQSGNIDVKQGNYFFFWRKNI